MQANETGDDTAGRAIENYAASLYREGYELAAYGVLCDGAPANCLFSIMQETLADSMFPQTGEWRCPFVLQALDAGEIYAELSSVRERFSDMLSETLLLALEALEFDQLAVLAKDLGDTIHLSVIGFNGIRPDANERERLASSHSQFSAGLKATVSLFEAPAHSRNKSIQQLSAIETRFVDALLSGKSNLQIAMALGLTEVTIRLIEKSVCNKLNAQDSRELIVQFQETELAKAS